MREPPRPHDRRLSSLCSSAAAVLVPVLNLALPAASPFHLSDHLVPLLGKYLCFALLALSVDLIWGFCGILSLGHGAFFALGGYAMGMYLMRQIGPRGVYANPILPDFMVFLNWKELPWFWHGFDHFFFAALMVLVVPGAARLRLRLVRLPLPRHRRLSLDHHPGDDLRADAGLLPQRHGLRRQQRPHRLQGHPGLPAPGGDDARRALRPVGARARRRSISSAAAVVHLEARQGAGRDPRRRKPHALPRLPRRALQALRLHALGDARGRRRRALRAAGRHHQSERIRARELDRGRDLGRGRRPRHAVSARPSARSSSMPARPGSPGACRSSGSSRSAACSSSSPCSCRRASSAPPSTSARRRGSRRPARRSPAPPCRSRRSRPCSAPLTPTLLYLDNVSVSFDGFRALNGLSLAIDDAEMRAIIGPNGAGKTTMMDVITGKTRPDDGQALFDGTLRSHRPRRGDDRGARHRAEVPDADGLRHAHGRGQPAPGAQGRPARRADPVLPPRSAGARAHRRGFSSASG